jgi:hypothetical protein
MSSVLMHDIFFIRLCIMQDVLPKYQNYLIKATRSTSKMQVLNHSFGVSICKTKILVQDYLDNAQSHIRP